MPGLPVVPGPVKSIGGTEALRDAGAQLARRARAGRTGGWLGRLDVHAHLQALGRAVPTGTGQAGVAHVGRRRDAWLASL